MNGAENVSKISIEEVHKSIKEAKVLLAKAKKSGKKAAHSLPKTRTRI